MVAANNMQFRHVKSVAGVFMTAFCASAAAIALILILGYVTFQGVHAINIPFLTQLPRPVGVEGGGVANGIMGSLIIVGLATVFALPVGVFTGIYVVFYGHGFMAEMIRFLSDVLSGLPSIAIGLFAYTVAVQPFGHFSGVSAAIAFAIIMLPLIIRTTEEGLRSVPVTVREGALALGLPVSITTMRVVIPAASSAIITGLLLAIARVTGETAPLLFTAFGTQFWELNPNNPMAELSLQVFTYAISPYQSWHEQAWGGALILIVAVFVLNLAARAVFRPMAR